ncbi:hypothetical protein J3R04_005573 [Spirilliplanes yamanashiensis]|nr:hypothetical protein [Spirilliplanes yamanashiensis]
MSPLKRLGEIVRRRAPSGIRGGEPVGPCGDAVGGDAVLQNAG